MYVLTGPWYFMSIMLQVCHSSTQHVDSDVPHHGSVRCFDTVTNFMGFRHRNIVSVLNADVAQNGFFFFFLTL